MKKILIVSLILLSFGLISCDSNEAESEFVDVVETEDAVFTVEVDTLSINSVDDWVNIDIEIKAKKVISRSLPTTSYGEAYVIQMQSQNIQDEELRLNSTGVIGNCAVGVAYLNINEKLERSFGLYIDSYSLGDKEASFYNGEYRIYVQLSGDSEWVMTDLVIKVNIQ